MNQVMGIPSQYEKPWIWPPPDCPTDDLPPANAQPNQSYLGIQDYCERNDYPERGDRYRHYMIVFFQDVNDPPPANAFVCAKCDGNWYYIDGDDTVSKRNFALVNHFLAIQAVPQERAVNPDHRSLAPRIKFAGGKGEWGE